MYEGQDDFLAREQGFERQVVGEQQVAIYLAKVMGWMCLGLFTTVAFTILCLNTEFLYRFVLMSNGGYLSVIIAQLAVVMILSFAVGRMGPAMATVMFMAYAALTGLTMSVFVLVYQLESLMICFGLTAFLFLTMSLYGFATKRDLTRIGTLAVFGLFGIVFSGLINMFFRSSSLDFAICAIGVLIFIVLIAYDTQRIKGFYLSATGQGLDDYSNEVRSFAIIGALTLYLDFINMFLKLLRLMGRRRN